MNKTIWNSNVFVQSVEFVLFWFLLILNISTGGGVHMGWHIFIGIVFFLHQLFYAVHGMSYYKEPSLKVHMWFLYVFVPFASFHDTYEEAHEKKPMLKSKLKSYFKLLKKEKKDIFIDKSKIKVLKEDTGWSISVEDTDGILVIVNDNGINENDVLLSALNKALDNNLIN